MSYICIHKLHKIKNGICQHKSDLGTKVLWKATRTKLTTLLLVRHIKLSSVSPKEDPERAPTEEQCLRYKSGGCTQQQKPYKPGESRSIQPRFWRNKLPAKNTVCSESSLQTGVSRVPQTEADGSRHYQTTLRRKTVKRDVKTANGIKTHW